MKKVICFFLTLVMFLTGCTPAVPSETTVSETESVSIPEPIIKDSYYFALINSDYLTQNDNNAINAIIDSYSDHDVYLIDVKGKKDSAVYITSSDLHANHGYQVLPVANCTLSIDIPIEIFESEQFLTLAFEYATNFQICTITGFESLLK